MKNHLGYLFLVFFILSSNVCVSQNTRKFTGKLVSFDGNDSILANVSVRLVNQGPGKTGTDGIFVISINNNVEEITLELVQSNLTVVYPAGGRINVPKNQNAVVEFVVGDSPKEILTKAVARSNNEIKDRLSKLGIKQDGIEETLNAFLVEIQKMSDIKRADINSQIDLASKREVFYPELASTINNYINEAKDLKDAFKFNARHAFDDAIALQLLTESIKNYNAAFEELNRKHAGYEKNVTDYWQSNIKSNEVKELFNYALGEIHSANIFTLNLKVDEINDLNRRNLKESKKKFLEEIILRDIASSQLQLERRLEELNNRAQVVLSQLAI